ncbi:MULTISPECIES: chemotaxis protein CheW [Clostridium]|uniref:chemotaxis protein CheW n=1 Tax=Clostridium TaxID=1485 RepID=UPI000826A6D3|nr:MULTISPECIES: chemotaxis protein CheW [Clostridium]PJI08206.1 chemotaxis protein CheW [Clostridium sp. CT7]
MAEEELIEEDTQKDKFLTFTIENEFYGIEIKHVIEIIVIQDISKIPELPEYIKGIINLRGKIIPVMDVRLRFKKKEKKYNDRTCIIIIELEDVFVGLIVDGVSEVVNIPDSEIVSPPEISRYNNEYIRAIGKTNSGIKLILDCNKLLKYDDVKNLQDI